MTYQWDYSISEEENFLEMAKQQVAYHEETLATQIDYMARYFSDPVYSYGGYIGEIYARDEKRARKSLKELTFWREVVRQREGERS